MYAARLLAQTPGSCTHVPIAHSDHIEVSKVEAEAGCGMIMVLAGVGKNGGGGSYSLRPYPPFIGPEAPRIYDSYIVEAIVEAEDRNGQKGHNPENPLNQPKNVTRVPYNYSPLLCTSRDGTLPWPSSASADLGECGDGKKESFPDRMIRELENQIPESHL